MAVTRPRTRPWRRALPIVGLAMAVWFVSRLDVHAMVDALVRARPALVLAAMGAMGVNVFVKALRWQRLLVARGAPVPIGAATRMFLEAAFLGSFTIGRIGEFVRVMRLSERGVASSLGFASCLVDRGLDVAALVVVGGAALLALTSSPLVGGAALAIGVVALALGSLIARRIAASAPSDGAGLRARAHRLLVDTAGFLVPAAFAEAMLWTALSWLPAFAVVWILAAALDVRASLVSLTAAQAIASLSTLLPITYQGVGTREPIFAAVLGREGVASERAVLLALATFVVMLVSVVILGALELAARRRRG